ncbi:leucine carboxyl methyltransferase, C3HC4 type (RING finger) zinc finger containing protein [Histoplasma capsulatum var. duboisii H88]|uniref:Leucine carboxyl methyltransferase, C3HC4 type (RING finger) zinc finger containing protein n=1 Tax=Ajellomyces capsulatus (strain H88) TaxID=544711 RepID=A0A8A1L8A5_AJEC8|nr:leucine carboxyl methyltransferase, C3HC4 type (RING finger) zinc finger containing protein [Histoplasma capsulatum var. duboisii H88]
MLSDLSFTHQCHRCALLLYADSFSTFRNVGDCYIHTGTRLPTNTLSLFDTPSLDTLRADTARRPVWENDGGQPCNEGYPSANSTSLCVIIGRARKAARAWVCERPGGGRCGFHMGTMDQRGGKGESGWVGDA